MTTSSSTRTEAAAVGDHPVGPRVAAHLFTVLCLVAWALYAQRVPAYQLPGPVEVGRRAIDFVTSPADLAHLAISIGHVVAAVAIAFLVGFALALLAHAWPVFRLMVHGRISPFLNSFSGIGWTLLAVIWFGLGHGTVLFAISAVLTPFAIINMRAGLENLDPELLEMARSFGRSPWRSLWRIVLPALLPFMFATWRVSFGVAWKVALTAELFGGNAGFGYLFNLARQEFDTALILVVIAHIVVFVFVVDRFLFAPIERRLGLHHARG
ncbi:MAG: ABC transporter permease subunit [Ectothiorhodospiraceae bacterium]|nr:ABC transporter permease subunit [Ectothiorhodospiraceae bacterium]